MAPHLHIFSSKLRLTRHACPKIKEIYCLFNATRNTSGLRTMTSEADKAEHAKHERGRETVFDQIIARKIRADIIFEDEYCLAFNDVNPQAPVHFLVIPKKRIPMLDEATENDKDVLSQLLLTAKNLAKKRLPNGYRVVINNGRDGCQSVYHLHVHVLGGRRMHWPPG